MHTDYIAETNLLLADLNVFKDSFKGKWKPDV